MRSILFLLSVSAVLAQTSLQSLTADANAGVKGSLSWQTIQEAKAVYFQRALHALNQVQVPNTNFKHGHVKGIKFHVDPHGNHNVQITPDAKNNAVRFHTNDVQAHIHIQEFYFKWGIIPAVKTRVDIYAKHVQVDFELGIHSQKATNGNLVPSVKVLKSTVNIPKHSLKIKMHGNLMAKIVSIFKTIFMGIIRPQVNKHLGPMIGKGLPGPVNAILAKSKGDVNVFKGINLDWSLQEEPHIRTDRVEFGTHGQLYPTGKQVKSIFHPPVMPYFDGSMASKFQVAVSADSANAAAKTFIDVHGLHFLIKSLMVPKNLPLQMNTDDLGFFLPGLKEKYGAGIPVDLELQLMNLDHFSSQSNDKTMSFKTTIAVNLLISGKPVVSLVVKDCKNEFSILVNNMKVQARVSQLHLGDILIKSSFGNLDLQKLANLLNKGIAQGLPYFNEALTLLPLNIPTDPLFGLFSLSDVDVKYGNNFVSVGLTPHFVKPKPGSDWDPTPIPDTPWTCTDPQISEIDCETESQCDVENDEDKQPDADRVSYSKCIASSQDQPLDFIQ